MIEKVSELLERHTKLIYLIFAALVIIYLLYEGLLSQIEFWKIPIPLLIAIIIWHLNEKSKRLDMQYNLKVEIYGRMLETISCFYPMGDPSLKPEFLKQYRKLWVVANDDVINSVNEFFVVAENAKSTQDEKQSALGDVVSKMRQDLISNRGVIIKETKLDKYDFKHVT